MLGTPPPSYAHILYCITSIEQYASLCANSSEPFPLTLCAYRYSTPPYAHTQHRAYRAIRCFLHMQQCYSSTFLRAYTVHAYIALRLSMRIWQCANFPRPYAHTVMLLLHPIPHRTCTRIEISLVPMRIQSNAPSSYAPILHRGTLSSFRPVFIW